MVIYYIHAVHSLVDSSLTVLVTKKFNDNNPTNLNNTLHPSIRFV